MINIAIALNAVFVLLYCVFYRAGPIRFEPGILAILVLATYALLRIFSAEKYLQPTMAVHVLFGIAYAIPAATMLICAAALDGDANALGAALLFGASLIPAYLFLAIGFYLLFFQALKRIRCTESQSL